MWRIATLCGNAALRSLSERSGHCHQVPQRQEVRPAPFPFVAPAQAASPTADPAVLCFNWRRPGEPGRSTFCGGVALSRKGAKIDTRGRKLRSTGTKVRSHVACSPESNAEQQEKLGYSHELEKKLQAPEHELAEARWHLSEALEQQTAVSD